MFNIITIFFCIQLLVAIVLYVNSQKTKLYSPLADYQNTTVIIPFRNEENRILLLLKSINQSAIHHKKDDTFSHLQFIFIDDHSTDDSCNLILNELDITFNLVRLRQTKGKKHAIKRGVELAKFDRILTLDADVTFNEKYLSKILKTPCNALTILEVKMSSNSILRQLFSVEFWFLQRLTFGLKGALCNGANLLFTKQTFEKSLTVRTDTNTKSGDDIYLLQAVKKQNLDVLTISNSELMVHTLPPLNLSELLNQRTRWISKMKDLPSFLGGLFILFSNVLFGISIYFGLTEDVIYLSPLLLKLLSEMISVQTLKQKFIVLLHQFYYPIYLILLLINLPFLKRDEKWT